jgi:hypothetical protein
MSKDADYLVGRLAMGDNAALGELIARYRGGVIGYFRNRSYLTLDFEHLAGLVFDRVARNAPRYIAQGRFSGWLFAIARNVLRDEIKRYKRERERNGLWRVSKNGNVGTHAKNWTGADIISLIRPGANTRKSSAGPASAGSDAIGGGSSSEGGRNDVVDVSFHARGIDFSARFSPSELRRRGYDVPKELKQMFRRFGLVDGPTPAMWEKSYKNMKINDSKSAVDGVITMEGGSSPILNGAPPPPERDGSVATCAICARRTKCEPVGAESVCRRCEREAASNWFTSRQIAIVGEATIGGES